MLRGEDERAACHGKRIGILIVTYNAVTTLTKVLRRITPQVWANVEEIAVFDDASQDSTYELALGMKTLRHLPKLCVLRHPKNLGYGGNQKAGYQYFLDKGFDAVVLLHGDGQYAPEILSHVYSPIIRGEADAVFGSRMMSTYGGPLKGGMPLYKYLGNRVLSMFENVALGMTLTEFHSGYRAYNLHAIKKIDFREMTNDFHFDTEIIIKLNHQRFRISEVPIPTYYGDEICYVNGVRYAKDVARAVYRYKQTCRSTSSYPEFKEYFVHYPIKTSSHSSHAYIQTMVGKNDTILDLGCGHGFFAAELKKAGERTITGVDSLPKPERREVLEDYISADLDSGADIDTITKTLAGKKFDSVLLLDVLEHLTTPERLLQASSQWVEENGTVIVSLPNVAHLYVRLMLLVGRFDYQDRGILDRTHLRWFTRKTARKFFHSNGFRIVRERATVVPLELVIGLSPSNVFMRMLNVISAGLTRIWPTLFGYQFIFVLAADQRREP